MIEKLKQTVRGFDDKPAMPTAIEFFNKINELVDAVNSIVSVQEKLIDSRFVVETKHEAPVDKYAEQRKWIGCICRFWNDESVEDSMYGELVNICNTPHENFPFQCGYGEWYAYCEPIKPDDDIIYKGE